jgi:hypothetical protein
MSALIGKPEDKRSLVTSCRTRKDHANNILKKVCVRMLTAFQRLRTSGAAVPQKARNSLTILATISFSRRILSHEIVSQSVCVCVCVCVYVCVCARAL